MTRPIKVIVYLLTGLIGLIVLSILLLSLVLSTPFGTSRFLSAISGDQSILAYGSSQGSLARDLEFTDLTLNLGSKRIHIHRLLVNWDPMALLSARVQLHHLLVQGLELENIEDEPLESPEPLEWPGFESPLPVFINRFEFSGLNLGQAWPETSISGSAHLLGAHLELNDLRLEAAPLVLDLQGDFDLKLPYQLNLVADWHYNFREWPLAGHTELEGDLNNIQVLNRLDSPAVLRTRGTVGLTEIPAAPQFSLSDLVIQLNHELEAFVYPLEDTQQIVFENMAVQTQGSVGNLALVVKGNIAADYQSQRIAGELNSTANLGVSRLTLTEFKMDSDRGLLEAQGEIDWSEGLSVALGLQGEHLLLKENLPLIDLSGKLVTEVQAGAIDLSATELELTGQYDEVPFRITGEANYKNNQLEAPRLILSYGEQQLEVAGLIYPQMDFSWQILASQPSQLLTDLSADLSGGGQVQGTLKEPRIQANLMATDLVYRSYRAKSLQIAIQPDRLGLQTFSHNLSVKALQILAAGRSIDEFLVEGKANPKGASLQMQMRATPGNLDFAVNANLVDERWNIAIPSVNFTGKEPYPDLRLAEPLSIHFDSESVAIPRQCWILLRGNFCAEATNFQLSDKSVAIVASVRNLDAFYLLSFLPSQLIWSSEIDADMNISISSMKIDTVKIYIRSDEGEIRLSQSAQNLESLRYQDLSLAIASDGTVWTAVLEGKLPAESFVLGEISYQSESSALTGTLDLQLGYLGWLEGISTRVEQPSGTAFAHLDIEGTASAPELKLDLRLESIGGLIVDTGVQISNSSLRVISEANNQFELEGLLNSPTGQAALSGSLDLSNWRDPTFNLSATGSNFQLVNRPDMSVTVNPDLMINYRKGVAALAGQIDIPQAYVTLPEAGPQTIRRSADEIIVGQENLPTPASRFTGRIEVRLGDGVELSGHGLRSKLSGVLDAEYRGTGDLRLHGTLNISDGEYEAYGRILKIEQGSLIFTGESDNPGINILATQTYPEYSVGIRISGTARNPQTTLFSAPPMAQSDILAILVTGRSMNRIAEGDAPSLLEAIDSLNIVGGESLNDIVKRSFGLTDFRITDDQETGESLVAGKYILPRLYVELVQSLFDRTATLGLEYSVNDQLKVRAQTGNNQSMELIYVIERP